MPDELIRGLSLTQPWATLVAIGEKRIETRSWPTMYRGLVAIHAAKGFPKDAQEVTFEEPFASVLERAGFHSRGVLDAPQMLPKGAIVAVAELVTCVQFKPDTEDRLRTDPRFPPHEADFGDYAAGRHGFVLTSVKRLPKPIPCRGALGLWALPPAVRAQLAEVTK